MGLKLVKTALIALLSLAIGYAAALGIGLAAFEAFGVSQREGANAMALAFVICPLIAVLTSTVAAIVYWITSGRPGATMSPLTGETPRSKAMRFFLVAVSAVVGWLAGLLLQWVLAGRSYETFLLALSVSLAPWIGMLVLGCATTWLTRRHEGPSRGTAQTLDRVE
jgi:hypothetical protein